MTGSGAPSGQKIGKKSAETGAPASEPLHRLPRVGEAPPSGRLPRVAEPVPPVTRLPRVGEATPAPPSGRLPRVAEPAPAFRLPRREEPDPQPESLGTIAIDLPPAVVAPADPVLKAEEETGEDEGEGALVVVCDGELGPAQAEALSKVTGKSLYEVKLRFKDPLPRVLLTDGADEVASAAEALKAAGVDAMAFAAEAILGDLRPFKVQQVRLEGPTHVVLGGPRGEVRLDLSRPAFLALGIFDFTAKVVGSLGQAQAQARFGHLYAGDWDDPLELLEHEIKDWSFLGADLSPVRRQNFDKLLALLQAPGGVTSDDRLVKHHGRLGETTPASGGGTVGLSEKTNLHAADTVSRVLYHRWRLAEGHAAATLAGAVEVLSTKESPEALVAARFGGGPTGNGGDGSYTASGGAAPGPRPTSGRLLTAPAPDPAPLRTASGRFQPGRTASGRVDCRPPGASAGDDSPLPIRTRAAPPPPPPPTGTRKADGTVYCPTCKLSRMVNHFGRCIVCGFMIATKAEASAASAFMYHFSLWWRLPVGVLFLGLGGLSVVVVPKFGVLCLLLGFLFVIAWAAEFFFGITIRVRDYIRLR